MSAEAREERRARLRARIEAWARCQRDRAASSDRDPRHDGCPSAVAGAPGAQRGPVIRYSEEV